LQKQKAEHWSLRLSKVQQAALFFLLPAFISFSLFSWYPMFKGLVISFFDYHPIGTSAFIGFANYARAFHDAMFWRTLFHAAGFCLAALGLGFWLPIFLAIFIRELPVGKRLLRFCFFLPFLMPTVPAAILWKWMMDQGFGLFNSLIALLGVAHPHVGWLTNPRLALFSIVLLYLWKNTGWAVLIYSAGLGNVDETLYEEAEMDGASIWDKVWKVTLPALRGVIGVMLIITIINTLQLFTEVYIMTSGGPMNATEVITTYIYKQAFFYMDIGYASALSVLLLLMLLVITLFRLRRLDPEGA
jgi:multiple sugar transport system permease protein